MSLKEIVEDMNSDIGNIRAKFTKLSKERGANLEQRQAILRAEDGFRFWQRTHFAELIKSFKL
jgi:hypothetical protein